MRTIVTTMQGLVLMKRSARKRAPAQARLPGLVCITGVGVSLAPAALIAIAAHATGCGSSPASASSPGDTGAILDAGVPSDASAPVDGSSPPALDASSEAPDSAAGHDGGDAASLPNPIIDGQVRFTVISPTLIRAEYAVDSAFTDATTFTAVARPLAASGFTTSKANGFLTVTTSKLTLSYREGSGRFARDNLTLTLAGSPGTTANPFFYSPICPMGQVCEAEAATLAGRARVVANHTNHTGPAFVDTWQPGASATWNVQGVTPGSALLQIRYANASGNAVTMAWSTAGGPSGTVSLPTLTSWESWAIATVPFNAANASFALTVSCTATSLCAGNVDSISVTAPGASFPNAPPINALGGWRRGLDSFSGSVPLYPGMLSRNGWYLLDDGQTALWDGANLPTARPHADVDHQDGYVFGYGTDYTQALQDFATIAGPPPMLPRYAFGVMFSEFFAYHDTDWENTIIPAFRAHMTPIDAIGIDTDWKSPVQWDGWEWNQTYFPDPQGFASWAKTQHVQPLLNIHPVIDTTDPQYASVVKTAGLLTPSGSHMAFDVGRANQLAAFASLNKPLIDLGMVPWLDWCCDGVIVSVQGLSPDGWMNQQYASWIAADGRRGFSLARAGSLLGPAGYPGGNDGIFPGGQWADHRTTIDFTGDTYASWDMLAFEAQMTAAQAAIDVVYTSHDIGSFHQVHLTPEEMYARWVQLGTFQPTLRLHSDHGDRLPWEYGTDVEASAETFLRLREAMLPYNYTLGWQAHTTGAPLARPLWYTFPDADAAYTEVTEYMWGDALLVAPVTVPGTTATTAVWFPPGQWIAFTDAGLSAQTFTGPGSSNVTTSVASMPVFARAGAIVPMQSATDNATETPATLEPRVFGGADGQFTLYEDAGEGFGYASGQSATTLMTLTGSTFTIAATSGTYPGAPATHAYGIRWANVDLPTAVTVNGTALPTGGTGEGWSYDATARTVTIVLAARPVNAALAIQLM